MFDISIIIVNYNTKRLLKKCLKTLLSDVENINFKYEIVVVDNASSDGSIEMLEDIFPEVRVIKNIRNLGFGKANNIGMKSSHAYYYLLINTDAFMTIRDVEKLYIKMQSSENVGILGPMVLNVDKSIQFSCRKFPSFIYSSFHALFYSIFPNNPFSKYYLMVNWNHATRRVVDWVSGCCMLIDSKAIEEVGYFDEAYFMYVEDVDLCFKMKRNGWEIVYEPSVIIEHHSGASGGYKNPDILLEFHRSQYLFCCKRYINTWKWNFRYFIKLGLSILLFIRLKGKNPKKIFMNFLFDKRGNLLKKSLKENSLLNLYNSLDNKKKA